MADTKISDMTAASALTGAEIVPVVQSGANRRTTTQDIADLASAGGATNLAYTASPTGGIVTSDTGTDATLTLADATNAGLMSPAQHSKLAGIASGATANATDAQLRDRSTHTGTQTASTISDFTSAASAAAPVQSVAGRTGAVTLAAADIGDSTAAGQALLTAADAAAQRTALGLGSAATASTGTSAGNVVVLDGSARLPAVDGSQLTNLPSGGGSPGGSDPQVQFNDGGSFGGAAGLTYDKTTKSLSVSGSQWSLTLNPSSYSNRVGLIAGGGSFGFLSDAHGLCIAEGRDLSLSDSGVTSTPTVGIRYSASGVACISDGQRNSGLFRDLKLRNLIATGRVDLPQYTTATRPAFTAGALIYDSDLDKALIGGVSAWEVVTSS